MEPVTTAALIGGGLAAGGSIISSALGMNEGSKQRRFLERMEATKYQRAVADMRAAGLNPIMAAGGGQVSSGGTPSVPDVGVNLDQLGENLTSAAKLKAIDKVRVENETKTAAATVATAASTQEVNSANAAKSKVEAAVLAKEVDNKVAHKLLMDAQTDLTRASARNVRLDSSKKEVTAEGYKGVKGIIDGIKDSAFGKAMSGTWKYWTSPSQTYANGQGNVNGGLHSAHGVKKARELGASHVRGADTGGFTEYNRSQNRRIYGR